MADARTEALVRLLEAKDSATRDAAWATLVTGYSRLILHVAHSVCGDHDGAMDGYTCVLEQLSHDDFRRLRSFVADGRSEFSTWLLVVAQRICLDRRRHIYGRPRGLGERAADSGEEARARARLVDLIGADIDITLLPDDRVADPEREVRTEQMHAALESALCTLEPQDRLLIKLRFEDELSMPEIARNLDLPSRFHAYRRLRDVLARLKSALARNGISDGEP